MLFTDNPIFDPYEPYLSTCSSMESLTASDVSIERRKFAFISSLTFLSVSKVTPLQSIDKTISIEKSTFT